MTIDKIIRTEGEVDVEGKVVEIGKIIRYGEKKEKKMVIIKISKNGKEIEALIWEESVRELEKIKKGDDVILEGVAVKNLYSILLKISM